MYSCYSSTTVHIYYNLYLFTIFLQLQRLIPKLKVIYQYILLYYNSDFCQPSKVQRETYQTKVVILPFGHQMSVFDFRALKPNMRAGFDHGSLNNPHQATMNLSNLTQHNIHIYSHCFQRGFSANSKKKIGTSLCKHFHFESDVITIAQQPSLANIMTSMGEVWLATQIPPFLGLFSLEELGQEANYLVCNKNAF